MSNNACSHCQILSINVGGLNKRLQSPDFEEFIQSYSIVCIQETHFDHFDSIHIPGFTPLHFMIRDKAKYRSGGIAILVKEAVFDKINTVKNSGENFIGFHVQSYLHLIFFSVPFTFHQKEVDTCTVT